MARYRLLAGQHIQADKSKPIKGEDGKPTGRFEKQTFTARSGSFPTVESETDLVAKHGPGKYELVDPESAEKDAIIRDLRQRLAKAETAQVSQGSFRTPGDPTQENLENNPATAPNGQVSTGFQGGPPKEAAGQSEGQKASTKYTREELDAMHVPDLKELAENDEIDLGGAKNKGDIIDAILASQ